MGTIGTVRAVFEADTSKFDASVKAASQSLGEVGQQAQKAGQQVDAATRLQEAAARRFQRVLEETKAQQQALAGVNVTAGAEKVAAATRAQEEAYARLSKVQRLVRTGYLDEAEAVKLLAAAQQNSAMAGAAVAAAKKAEAAAVKRAAEEEALSQNVVIRAFQRVAIAARESMAEVKARVLEAAEAGGLEAEGIGSAFAGIGKLMGAGLAVGFAASFMDGIAKSNLELGHLQEKTGLAAVKLAGLRQVTTELGGDFDAVGTAIIKLNRSFDMARGGNKQALSMFGKLGITRDDLLQVQNATQLVELVARKMAHVEDQAKLNAGAIGLMGRGASAVIPVLKQMGDNFDAAADKAAKSTGVTEDSIAAAERWTRNVAKLHAVFERFGNFAIETAPEVLQAWVGAFDSVGVMGTAVFDLLGALIVGTAKELYALGKTLADAIGGILEKLPDDVAKVKSAFVDEFKGAFKDIKDGWSEAQSHFQRSAPEAGEKPLPFGKSDGDEFIPTGPKSHAAEKAAREQMEAFENQFADMEKAGNADVFTTRAFWEKKIQAMKKGAADYDAVAGALNFTRINEKLAAATKAMDEELKKSLHHKDGSADAFAREQEHAADEQIQRVAEIRQQAADAMARLQERGQLSDVSIALTHGEITRYQAAVAEARIHAAAFDAEIADVEKRLAEAEALRDLPGAQEQIAKLQAKLAELRGQAEQQARQDSSAVNAVTPGGAMQDAFRQWVQQATDAAALIHRAFEEAAQGINDSLAGALTDPRRMTGHERMMELRNGLGGTFSGLGKQALTFGMAKMESLLPGGLGKLLGGGKKPTGAKGDPLHVVFDAGALGTPAGGGNLLAGVNLPGLTLPSVVGPAGAAAAGGGGGGFGGFVTGMVAKALPFLGFASGGPIAPDMGPFLVGEAGPEILNVGHASAHVTPNSALKSLGGGSVQHSYNIDARGAHDPAATEAAVMRALYRAAPTIAHMGMQGTREDRLRRAPSAGAR